MEYRVDTAIVGAGPSGSACAITLQKAGVPCLLIDKKSFPRSKTCGGGVTEKTYLLIKELLGERAEDVFCGESGKVELYLKERLAARADVGLKYRFVKREVFDKALVDEYERLGGKLLDGAAVTKISRAEGRMTLSNGDAVYYSRLVCADGAKSALRSALGANAPTEAFCVECHVPYDSFDYGGEVRIFLGIPKKGYAWVFPSGDEVCIGLGGLAGRGDRFDEELKDFLKRLGVTGEYGIKGAFVPYGEPVDQTSLPENCVLVGDAAGFADPLTGEGLYFALASGIAAAECAASRGGVFRDEYLGKTERLRKIISEGVKVQSKLYLPGTLPLLRKIVSGRSGFVSFVFDELVSTYNYSYSGLNRLREDYKK